MTDEKTYLECTTGNSNKFYEIWIEHVSRSNTYKLWTHYGRIGLAGTTKLKKTYRYVTGAEKGLEALKKTKLDKGYELKKRPSKKKKAPSRKKKEDESMDDILLNRFSSLL